MLNNLTDDEITRLIRMEIAANGAGEVKWPELVLTHGNVDECSLVAVCVALEIDYQDESLRYEQAMGCTMGWSARHVTEANHHRMKDFLEGLWGQPVTLFFRSYPISDHRTWERDVDLSGVGVMTARNNDTGDRHAVAYENGWVYDGNAPSPLRYQVWALEVGANVVIDGMSKMKEKK